MQNRPIKTPVSNLTGLNLYAECKKIDGLPPNVEGTYARCLLEVLRAQKRVARYLWATSPDDIKMWVLSTGPVLVGTPWYSGMFTPDPNGFVKPTGSVVGGHEYLVRGYSRPLKAFRCRNSWGNSWGIGRGVKWAGDGGEFWIDETTLYDLIWKQWGDAIGIEEARA